MKSSLTFPTYMKPRAKMAIRCAWFMLQEVPRIWRRFCAACWLGWLVARQRARRESLGVSGAVAFAVLVVVACCLAAIALIMVARVAAG